MQNKSFLSGPLLGAAFLMATSAIGPGFITQTTKFTEELKASFGFVIFTSILIDIGAQLNIWRIISISKLYAQDLANKLLPGSGYVLSFLIILGGLAFNIGNVAGAGLGLQVLTGCSVQTGAIVSCVIAVLVFVVKEAGKAIDAFAKLLGFVMIALTLFVAFQSNPPMGEAVVKTFIPDTINETIILTIVGGTVGGYISFAGAHCLLEAGIYGKENLRRVSTSAVSAILIASLMRLILFIAALGIVWQGITLDKGNPAATVFQSAAGKVGYRIFGLVLWSAAITSVVGSAFTSVTFAKLIHPAITKNFKAVIVCFIVFSTAVFLLIGQPVKVLIAAGAINGLILPFALAIILLAAYKGKIIDDYRHPVWLATAGWIVVVTMGYMGIKAIVGLLNTN
ncbi:NRAMP family divalent metal transporter [Terrimonas pollutisoli]|uniref:NRAMP family divalent metal transporter n=1 Tax=Terrimonas pollutisoli TaxID=3034147 RepID=UPI0023EC0D87|nr:NRAMP family divalent metal transporter [Terrimonas sp. H1YJ31]